jgi:predicted Zn-dependent peptidase
MLSQGQDSKLNEALVQKKGYTNSVSSGINIGLGNMYDYNGPMLWISNLIHDASVLADSIIRQYDLAIADIANNTTKEDLELALVKIRSGLYDAMGGIGIGKVNLLAVFALFDDDPTRINKLESEFKKVTPELIRSTAQKYLVPSNRTILIIEPKASK